MQLSSLAPRSFRRVIVNKLSTSFRECTSIVTVPLPNDIRPTEVIVLNKWAGINASDINYTAGVYKPGMKPPFECGFEALGQVVGVGEKVTNVALGDAVLTQSFGAFSEVQVVPSRNLHKVPSFKDPRLLALEISGVTASVALKIVAEPVRGEVALVTAAAGGTGHFAVQLLKHVYGCKVVGTCGGPHKAQLLRSLGCDRVIDYKMEDVDAVLSKEFPHGVNLAYESVGGKMFDLALKHLSVKGRIVVIGSIEGYRDGASFAGTPDVSSNQGEPEPSALPSSSGSSRARVPINTYLLQKSASLRGFFLPHFAKYHQEHFNSLVRLLDEGRLEVAMDPMPFSSIDCVAAAVERLHSGQSTGKVVVALHVPGEL